MGKSLAYKTHAAEDVREFFAWSIWIDYIVLRPLSHIAPFWEIRWDHDERRYCPENFSFADDLNRVIELVALSPRPRNYHEHEDRLAEDVLRKLKWPIQKRGARWIGADYQFILEQGAFSDVEQRNLISAAAGRVHAALDRGQKHFDEMEERHLYILAGLFSIIIYHRYCAGDALLVEVDESESD